MDWLIINLFGLVVAPAAFIWGWVTYAKTPNRKTWRMRASLLGLIAPILSTVVWGVDVVVANVHGHRTSDQTLPTLVSVGTWIAIAGALIGLMGRPKIAIAIFIASIGTLLFWFAITLP
jgi:hypothetical protein